MLWIFERGATVTELETRYDNDTNEYVLEVRSPNTADQIERFQDAETFRERLVEIERSLEGQNWRRTGPPIVLPQGWPDRPPSR